MKENLEAAWMAAMRRGDFADAWGISDRVLASRDPATRDDPGLAYHRRWVWDGRSFDDRDVLVRCYHGLGDTLQFARYLAPLRRRARSVTVEAPDALLEVLRAAGGLDRLVPFITDAPLQPPACDIEIMELGHALRLPPSAVPPPYLRAAPAKLPRGTLGLCWQAGGWDPQRSIPAPWFAALAASGAVALQPGASALPVLNPEGTRSIAEAASLISACALVVTVDTMVAHLAGALGRPTWLLLKHEADWRWMDDVADSPWYPSMRLIRQTAPGDWSGVMARVRADLGIREGGSRAEPPRPPHTARSR